MRTWLCLLLLPGLAAAEIYRWVDADGRVHFGQRPAAAGAEQVEVRPQVIERDAATRERLERTERFYDARRQEQADAAASSAQRQAKRDQECGELRRRLAQVPEGLRYYRKEANGERSYYSDEELDAARRQLRQRLAERCT
ncbi:DUF4124 domain-containing protein [Pseudomonas lalucatii]|uniref:DUF4124 domain-containing protein n=1 Tax=Pseudomonas lalucatii TaxID=1424203 RepID=A0ABS5PZ76_9PSED|nr:DUF4124 domain-containing protein [Pseudomonas lalucatii]MBS7661780.1 DUF4124 domain-containing protein [Pseudomonas lalucatii]MBS7690647.1 DUF4124 domain-containing protein [Pseudomonas lalucatii]MBS7726287.1 DUF4124 domain-containing protein [Pseudomonas lalucatii]QVM88139.1 DUF4124 domain-containing protein [Pseudomonas lalucatii]